MTRRYKAMIAWYRGVFEAEIVNRDPAARLPHLRL
jgi:uncharacterized glyoxalase superfamily protein PhnB